MLKLSRCSVLVLVLCASWGVQATGLATCDSGPQAGWQPVEKLEQQLKDKGYVVRRIKVDGGCHVAWPQTQ